MPGLRANLERRFDAWTGQVLGSRLLESEQGLLILTVAQVCRSRVLAGSIDDRVAGLIEPIRFAIVGAIGDPLADLRPARHDQTVYAEAAARLSRTVAELVVETRAAAGASDEAPPSRRMTTSTALHHRATAATPSTSITTWPRSSATSTAPPTSTSWE